VASLLTTALLAFLVFVPLTIIVWLFALEVRDVSAWGYNLVQSGSLQRQIDDWLATLVIPEWLQPVIPEGAMEGGLADIRGRLGGLEEKLWVAGQEAALAALSFAGDQLPAILQAAVELSVDTAIYLFAVVVLFMEGPRVLDFARKLSPMEQAYVDRLIEVFAEFSRNLVVGSLATAGIQGIIAGFGYGVVGMENVLFLAILTAVGSFVPVVGTVVIWVPVVGYLISQGNWGWAIFLTLWCLILVGGIDNVVKPLFMRGKSNIHPLLVFLAVFGGLANMNIAGLLVGPVFVAFFLALYQMYVEDFLGQKPPPAQPVVPWWEVRLRQAFLPQGAAASATVTNAGAAPGATAPARPAVEAPAAPSDPQT
jgi:predicted PurR-regulated permease PerM